MSSVNRESSSANSLADIYDDIAENDDENLLHPSLTVKPTTSPPNARRRLIGRLSNSKHQ